MDTNHLKGTRSFRVLCDTVSVGLHMYFHRLEPLLYIAFGK
jgi:hypothetical protein